MEYEGPMDQEYIDYLISLTPDDLEAMDKDGSPESIQVINDYLDYFNNYAPLE